MPCRPMRRDLTKVVSVPKFARSSLAGVAQLVEQLICNQPVGGSNPLASSKGGRPSELPIFLDPFSKGRFPSGQRDQTVNLTAYAFGGSNPPLPTNSENKSMASARGLRSRVGSPGKGKCGNSSVGRASAFQAEGRGFESRFPLNTAFRGLYGLGINASGGTVPLAASFRRPEYKKRQGGSACPARDLP